MTSRSRGGGGFKNCPILRTNSTDRLRECMMKGGRGSRNVKNLRDVIYGWSLKKTIVGQWQEYNLNLEEVQVE